MKTSRKSKDEKDEEDNARAKKRMKTNRDSRDELQKEEDKAKARNRMKEYRIKQLLLQPQEYRQSVAQNSANSRDNKIKTEEGRRKSFQNSVKYGPIFGCVSCHRLCFDTNVIKLKETFMHEMEECHPGLFKEAIGSYTHVRRTNNSYHLCLTCKGYLFRGKVPPPVTQKPS